MKIVVIGPGALGSLIAVLLAALPEHDVRLLDHDARRAARSDGTLLLERGEERICRAVPVTSDPGSISPADLVFVCVKSRDVAAVLSVAAKLCGSRSSCLFFQNGIGHLDVLAQAPMPVPAALGVTALGATLVRAGHIRFGGHGMTHIGFTSPVDQESEMRLERCAKTMRAAGIETVRVPTIIDDVWKKLLVNVGINALTVLHDCANGQLLALAQARETMIAAVREGELVARALGIGLDGDPVERTVAVCRATSDNISSMLQDIRRGRPTEIDAINGALVAQARKLGIDTPVNNELVRRVREVEKRRVTVKTRQAGRAAG